MNKSLSPRRRAREVAFQILYSFDSPQKMVPEESDELLQEVEKHFDHFEIIDQARTFARSLVMGVLTQKTMLDETISEFSKNWTIERMSGVDRNLLRMSTLEILQFADIPPSVTIDEALELGKKFGTTETAKFLNGVLDAIAHKKPTQD